MVSYWKLDDDGSTATDSVGTNNGALINSPIWVTGNVVGALQFNGANRVMIADSDSLTTPDALTLEAWIYPTEEGEDNKAIVAKQDYQGISDGQEFGFIMYNGGGLQFHACPTGGCAVVGVDSNYVPVNQWTYLVGVWDSVSGVAKIYINSQEAPTIYSAPATGQIPNTPARASIGDYHSFDGTYGFKGMIDEVAIYNRSLTAEEILQHYDAGLIGQGYCG